MNHRHKPQGINPGDLHRHLSSQSGCAENAAFIYLWRPGRARSGSSCWRSALFSLGTRAEHVLLGAGKGPARRVPEPPGSRQVLALVPLLGFTPLLGLIPFRGFIPLLGLRSWIPTDPTGPTAGVHPAPGVHHTLGLRSQIPALVPLLGLRSQILADPGPGPIPGVHPTAGAHPTAQVWG